MNPLFRHCFFPTFWSLDVSRWSLDVCRCLYMSLYIDIYIYISKIVTFINMVITVVKNGSPDMILTAFDGKFHEKKDEIPPGVHRPLYN